MLLLCLLFTLLLGQQTHSYQNWFNPFKIFGPDFLADNKGSFSTTEKDFYPTGWHYTTPRTNLEDCVSSCPVTSYYSPVCGTNGVTYRNIDQLSCVSRCGIDIKVKYWSECHKRVSLPNTLHTCVQVCGTEYSPVCGSNGVTYDNICILNCLRHCGVNVQYKRRGSCSMPSIPSTTPVSSLDKIQNCITTCPVTSEYNPVCGSNGETYSNMGRLQCAKECGVDVSISRHSPCSSLTSAPSIATETTPSVPFPDMTTKPTGFTVPQDILDAVFTNPIEDPDNDKPDIDIRYNNEQKG